MVDNNVVSSCAIGFWRLEQLMKMKRERLTCILCFLLLLLFQHMREYVHVHGFYFVLKTNWKFLASKYLSKYFCIDKVIVHSYRCSCIPYPHTIPHKTHLLSKMMILHYILLVLERERRRKHVGWLKLTVPPTPKTLSSASFITQPSINLHYCSTLHAMRTQQKIKTTRQ